MRYLIILFFFIFNPPVQAQDAKPCACCTEKHQEFHFWVGDWEAYGPKGNLAGTNHIVLLEDNCIMQENWKSASGAYTGTSYNWYSTQTGKWHQTWIDNQGGSLQLSGEYSGNQMILASDELKNQEGETHQDRITWTKNEDGSIRQHWEVTKDQGKTWTTAFDGSYKKKVR